MNIDPNTAALATTVIMTLSPFLQKGAEEFVKAAGKSAYEHVERLLGTIRRRFKGDAEAESTLQQFEAKPERYESAFEDILREKLAADASFVEELRAVVSALGPTITVIQELGTAGTVTGLKARSIKSGTVNVNQSADDVEDLNGIQLDGDIGS